MSGCRVFIGGVNPRATEMDIERFFKGFGRIRDINLKTGYGFVEFEDHRDADDAVYEMNNQTLCGGRITVEHAKGVPRNRGSGGGGGGYGGGGGGRDHHSGGGGNHYGGGGGGYGGRGRDYGNRYDRGNDRGYNNRSNSRFGPPSRTKYRMIVENVSSRVGWQDLKDMFRPVGEVSFAEVHQYIKGEGVVDFASHADLKNAIEKMDGTELMGRKLRLVEEKSQASRSRSRSRSRSSNRSRSRSRSRSAKRRSRSPRRRSRSPSAENGNGRGSKSPSPGDNRGRSISKSPERE